MSRAYPERPFVGVGVVVLKGDDVLLIRRGKPPRQGQWSLPGGSQETGETVFEAGAREVMEETGVEIGPPRLVDIIDSIQRDGDGRVRYHYTLIDLAAEWVAGEPVADTDAEHAEWMPWTEVPALEMWEETTRVIAEARRLFGRGA